MLQLEFRTIIELCIEEVFNRKYTTHWEDL